MSSETQNEMPLQQAKATWTQVTWNFVRSLITFLPDVQKKSNELNTALNKALKELMQSRTDVELSITTELSEKIAELINLNSDYENAIKISKMTRCDNPENPELYRLTQANAERIKKLFEKLEKAFNATVRLAQELKQKCDIEKDNCESTRSKGRGQYRLIFLEFLPPPSIEAVALSQAVSPGISAGALVCAGVVAAGTIALTVHGSFSRLNERQKEFEKLHKELDEKLKEIKDARKKHIEMAKSMADLQIHGREMIQDADRGNESQGGLRPRSATMSGSSSQGEVIGGMLPARFKVEVRDEMGYTESLHQ